MSIVILDDVISKEYQDYLETLLIDNPEMAWHLIKDLDHEVSSVKRTSSVGLSIQAITDGKEHGMLALIFKSLCYAMAEKLNIKVGGVLTARAFLQMPNNLSNTMSYHVDHLRPHKVLLYYVTESDGNTIILKQRYPFSYNKVSGLKTGEVVQEITPKKGRVVLFDGSHFHASSVPTTDLRCVININII